MAFFKSDHKLRYAELARSIEILITEVIRAARNEEAAGRPAPQLGRQAAVLNERRTQLLAAIDISQEAASAALLTAT